MLLGGIAWRGFWDSEMFSLQTLGSSRGVGTQVQLAPGTGALPAALCLACSRGFCPAAGPSLLGKAARVPASRPALAILLAHSVPSAEVLPSLFVFSFHFSFSSNTVILLFHKIL